MVPLITRLNRLTWINNPDENKCIEEVKFPVLINKYASYCMIKKACPFFIVIILCKLDMPSWTDSEMRNQILKKTWKYPSFYVKVLIVTLYSEWLKISTDFGSTLKSFLVYLSMLGAMSMVGRLPNFAHAGLHQISAIIQWILDIWSW